MRIYEFIDKYCQDLIRKNEVSKALVALDGLPNDGTIEDEDGMVVPIVSVDNESIPVADFLTMEKVEFLKVWTTAGAEEAFDNYLSSLIILEGEEALNKIRNSIFRETERLKKDVDLVTSI